MNNTILITRPQIQAEILAHKLSKHGIKSIISSVIQIKLCTEMLEQYDYTDVCCIIATSQYSIYAISQYDTLKNKQLIVVGSASMKYALDLGFKNVISYGFGSKSLKDLSKKYDLNCKFLYVRGNIVKCDMQQLTKCRNYTECIVYTSKYAISLTYEALNAIQRGKIGKILIYSFQSYCAFMSIASNNLLIPYLKKIILYTNSENVLHASAQNDIWKNTIIYDDILSALINE